MEGRTTEGMGSDGDVKEGAYKGRSKTGINPALPVVLIFITVILGYMVYPHISGVVEEPPVHQQYTTTRSNDVIVYENGELMVQIIKNTSRIYPYEAEWTDVYSRTMATTIWETPQDLMDDLQYYTEWLTEEQLRWYRYMLTNEVE